MDLKIFKKRQNRAPAKNPKNGVRTGIYPGSQKSTIFAYFYKIKQLFLKNKHYITKSK